MRLSSKLPLAAAALAVFGLMNGCGTKTIDCEALAAEQPDCMNEAARQDCADTNDQCVADGGDEVIALESCPLQFACSKALSTSN